MKFIKLIFIIVISFIINYNLNAQTKIERELAQHTYTLASDLLKGRKAGTKQSQDAAEYIINQWKEIGIEPYNDTSYLQIFNNKNFQNIVGIIRGNDSVLKDEYIIVGAHYDHLGAKNGDIYNGADDNASGIAVLIELAKKLKENQANLKRSIILIAFDAEEQGLIGSTYFAKNMDIKTENVKLMISVDMVGWYKTSGKVEYLGSGTIQGGEELIKRPELVPDGLNVVCKNFEASIFTATDTQPFAIKGIPTLAVTTGTKSPYHKPEDEADLIDYEGMAMITEHLNNIITTISQDINYQPSGKLATKHKQKSQQLFQIGLLANYGSNYHYYTEGAINGKPTTSFGAGLTTQFNFAWYAIRPEILYDRISAKHPAGTIVCNNVTIPVSLVLQTSDVFMNVDIFVGGYYSYCFNGQQENENIDFENTFNRNEFGLTFGVGMQLWHIKIGATSRYALTNFTKYSNSDKAHIQNRTSYFTLTYIF